MRTRDGYRVVLPRYRMRRLQRRLRTQGSSHPRERAAARLLDLTALPFGSAASPGTAGLVGLLVGRARRIAGQRYPVFTTRVGRRPVWIVTRATAPRRVELLYVRYRP